MKLEGSSMRASEENKGRGKNGLMHVQRDKPPIPFWSEDRGLSFFLAFLLVMTVLVPMFRMSRYERIGVDLIFALIFFSGAVATVRNRLLMYLIMALAILGFAADLIVEFRSSLGYWGWDTALKTSGLAILVVLTLKHTFRPGPVTVHRVMGGVAAYLLIGVTWAFGYKLLMEELPGAIHFQSFLGGMPTGEPSAFLYFSFSVLTSVGFGDAYPVYRVARSLAMAESLIGQLYPAILIATLVGMALQARSSAGEGS